MAGGKWTTYRRMAEDTVNVAQTLGSMPARPCVTEDLAIAAASETAPSPPLHPALPVTQGEVLRACREEMARRVEDVLARRSRCLLFDAAASIAVAPEVARLMAAELGRDEDWVRREIGDFTTLAARYRVPVHS
ncbi:MAG: hypothetical protein NTY41_01240 [Proteobacteria bacterium]|nr:hypothetical protein [Pseudomonadota bacterium]